MRCRSCNAEIDWALTSKGEPIPLDREPRPDGNLVIEHGKAVGYQPLIHINEPRRVAHFATCPHAAAWRKPR